MFFWVLVLCELIKRQLSSLVLQRGNALALPECCLWNLIIYCFNKNIIFRTWNLRWIQFRFMTATQIKRTFLQKGSLKEIQEMEKENILFLSHPNDTWGWSNWSTHLKKTQPARKPSPPNCPNQTEQSSWGRLRVTGPGVWEGLSQRAPKQIRKNSAPFPSFYRNLPQQVLVAKLKKGKRDTGADREE